VVDRTRSRLDVPKIRTIFGTAQCPRRTRRNSSAIEAAIETPTFDLTVFKLHFGGLTGKAYTKGERVLRFEAIAHNTAELRCGVPPTFRTADQIRSDPERGNGIGEKIPEFYSGVS